MKYFDYIVFDVDGTLADTEESVLSSLGQIIQEETGKTPPPDTSLNLPSAYPARTPLRNLGSTHRQRWIAGAKLPPALKAPSACFPACTKLSQHSPTTAANLASSPHVRATNTQKKLHPLASISILSTSSLSKTQPNINPHPLPCSNISGVRARILATSSTLATPSTTNNAQLRQGSVLPERHGDHTKTSQTPPTTSKPPTTY